MKHWTPEGEATQLRPPKRHGKRVRGTNVLTSWTLVDTYAPAPPPKRKAELQGAVAGLALVAVACIGVCFGLYQLLGPSDTFAG